MNDMQEALNQDEGQCELTSMKLSIQMQGIA